MKNMKIKFACNNDKWIEVLHLERKTELNYAFFWWIVYRPFSYCIDQAGLGAFTAKSGCKHYNPPPLTVMWMNFDSPNFPSLCSLSAIILFQTCSNKCILYVLSFHKCIKIKYKTVNMYGVFLWLVQSSSRWNTLSSQLPCSTVECSGRRILSPGQILIVNTIWE